MTKKLVIGLTGGIGSGKTTVANLFSEKGIDIVDTDLIARDVVKPGSLPLEKIKNYFGEKILQTDGTLNRRALREHVFTDSQKREWLEKLLHPLIREQSQQKIHAATSPYCIMVVPLLIEHLPYPLVDRILVVDVPIALQIKRAKERDHLSDAQINQILAAQADRETRLRAADDIIYNDQDLTSLNEQVNRYHQFYLKLVHSSVNEDFE